MSTTFHLIRSVKGGSGKTTFALHKATQLLKDSGKVLYIDADVHASETMRMLVKYCPTPDYVCKFYEFDKTSIDSVANALDGNRTVLHTLNSYMHPYRGYFSNLSNLPMEGTLKSVVSFKESLTSVVKGESMHFIFCDPTPLGRSVFGNIYQSSGKPVIGVGAYIAKIKSLLKFTVTKEYTDVVIDMPPGSDIFSSHLADTLIDFVSDNESHVLNIYYVSTMDYAHMLSAAQAAIEHLHVMRSSSPREVIFVLNEGRDNFAKYSNRKGIIDDLSKSLGSDIKFDLNRLEYVKFTRDIRYFDSFHSDSGQTVIFSSDDGITDLDGVSI